MEISQHIRDNCVDLLLKILKDKQIANDIETDLNKWQKKATKEIEERGLDEMDESNIGIVDIRNRVQLVRRIIQDTVETFEENLRGYEPSL